MKKVIGRISEDVTAITCLYRLKNMICKYGKKQ